MKHAGRENREHKRDGAPATALTRSLHAISCMTGGLGLKLCRSAWFRAAHMKTNDIAVTRSAPASACADSRRFVRKGHSALAASIAVCAAVSWGALSTAAPPASTSPGSSLAGEALPLETGCEHGDAARCNDLGVSHLRGYGVPVDVARAASAFALACSQGSPDGCGNLGALYETGAGVPQSLARAAGLYEQACVMGCALGCSNLGALHARGRGVERDPAQARRLFQLACETGSAAGCTNLMQLTSPLH